MIKVRHNRKLLPVLLSLGVLCSRGADAVEFDIDAGVNKYLNGVEGLWYVNPFEHDMRMLTGTAGVGVTQNLIDGDNWGLGIRGGFVYLGSIRTHASVPSWKTNTAQGAFVGPDFIGANQQNPCYGKCTYISTFNGSGSDRGFTLTLEPYWKYKDYKLSLSGGAYIHKATWSQNITGLNDCATCPEYDLNVEYKQGWRVGSTLGFSASKDNVFIKYQFFKMNNRHLDDAGMDTYRPAFNTAHRISIGFKF